MAKISFGALVTDVRNKIGGTVFTKVHSGPMVRKRVKPINPRSAAQLSVRASTTSLARAWGATLTQVQRAAWGALALGVIIHDKLGNPHHPTGLNLYVRVNRLLNTLGVARIDPAPADQAVTAVSTITPTYDSVGPAASVAYTPTPAPANHHVAIYASKQNSPGRGSSFGEIAFILSTAAAAASPTNILAAYTAKWGALVAGRKIRTRVKFINDTNGAASGTLEADVIVT